MNKAKTNIHNNVQKKYIDIEARINITMLGDNDKY